MPSPLTLPVRYTRHQPPCGTPICGGHPLAHGLAAFWPLNEGAGQPREALSRAAGTLGGATWAVGDAGRALQAVAASDHFDTGGFRDRGTPAGTVAWRMRPGFASNSSTEHYLWGQNVGPEFGCTKFSDGNWYVGWNANGDQRVVAAATPTNCPQGRWATYALTWSPSGSTFWHDGGMVASNGAAPNVADIAANFWWLREDGNGGSGAGGQGATLLEWTGLWSRALSPAEVRSLYLAPYSMF